MGQRRAWGARPESDCAKPHPKILIPLRKRAGHPTLAFSRAADPRSGTPTAHDSTGNSGDLARRAAASAETRCWAVTFPNAIGHAETALSGDAVVARPEKAGIAYQSAEQPRLHELSVDDFRFVEIRLPVLAVWRGAGKQIAHTKALSSRAGRRCQSDALTTGRFRGRFSFQSGYRPTSAFSRAAGLGWERLEHMIAHEIRPIFLDGKRRRAATQCWAAPQGKALGGRL